MTWTTPKTWSANEIVGAADMNTHIRDNLNELKAPPFYHSAITANWSANVTWTGISSLSAVLGTNGGDIMCGIRAHVVGARACFNLLIDGSAYTSAQRGIGQAWHANMASPTGQTIDFVVWITGLASGTHTFQPLMSAISTWSTLEGTTMPTLFWAREVS